MRRSIPVFIMLLAQLINLMTPVCFVRCVSADGRERVELAGLDCACLDLPAEHDVIVAEAEHESSCCGHHHEAAPVTADALPPVSDEDCDCQHSMMDAGDQNVGRSTVMDSIQCLNVAVQAPCSSSVGSAPVAVSGLRECSSRPHLSPHLLMLATTVLRV